MPRLKGGWVCQVCGFALTPATRYHKGKRLCLCAKHDIPGTVPIEQKEAAKCQE